MTDRSAVAFAKMKVGFNYPIPWNAYGIYLGSGNPPGASPGMDVWTQNLKANLLVLKNELDIHIVRIFLIGNGANYGTVSGGTVLPGPGSNIGDVTFGGTFTPPASLHPKVTIQLTEMFQAFQDTEMMVIPSLIDFKAFGRKAVILPGGFPNGATNRFDIVEVEATRRTFFDQVLRSFLTVSQPFRSVVYAWEVTNEPYWNYSPASKADFTICGGDTVSFSEMEVFLQEAVDIIESFAVTPKFRATVGHRFARDLGRLPTGKARQFHFYPHFFTKDIPLIGPKNFGVDLELPPQSETNAFLGEIGTSSVHGQPWPDLKGADAGSVRARVFERLKHAQSKGYALTLLWPDVADSKHPFPGPDPIKLSTDAQDGIKDFQKLPGPTTSP